MSRRPPFTALSQYAEALKGLVPDARGKIIDADVIEDALKVYNEQHPAVETQDIGDGSQFEWPMGSAPFTRWDEGFSENYPVKVEELTAGEPQRPQVWLTEDRSFWFERRYVSGVLTRVLVFNDIPSVDEVRVHFSRRHLLDNAGVSEVPEHHQMAVVWEAASLKCQMLAQVYRSSVDHGLGALAGGVDEKADAYERDAAKWHKRFSNTLGVGRRSQVTTGQIRTGTSRVFRRGYA